MKRFRSACHAQLVPYPSTAGSITTSNFAVTSRPPVTTVPPAQRHSASFDTCQQERRIPGFEGPNATLSEFFVCHLNQQRLVLDTARIERRSYLRHRSVGLGFPVDESKFR
jgi:hypothetical protein